MIEGRGSARLAPDQMLCLHVLAASLRAFNHLLCSFVLGAEPATVPSKVLQEWAAAGFPIPNQDFKYKAVDAKLTCVGVHHGNRLLLCM
jgi:hypothetical protein